MSRYIFLNESATNDNCFEAAVYDMEAPVFVDNVLSYKIVCKCSDVKQAKIVCKALNYFDRNYVYME